MRMLAALAGLLAIGATAASVATEMTALAIPVITALAFLLAFAVAAVLVAPGVTARFVRRGRLVPPATWRLAVVLAIGVVIVSQSTTASTPSTTWQLPTPGSGAAMG
jgi:hypothetical protein